MTLTSKQIDFLFDATVEKQFALYLSGSKPTPRNLAQEIVDKVWSGVESKYIVMFDYALAIELVARGAENVFFTATTIPNEDRLHKYMGINIVKLEEISNMKFDVVLGNPPFSKANEGKTSGKKSPNLYPKFFELSLQIADVVGMIMPRTDNQQQAAHNKRVAMNAKSIINIDDEVFKVTTSVWCVLVDKNDPTKIYDFTNTKIGNNIRWTKGKMSSSKNAWETESGFEVIYAVHKDGLKTSYADKFKPSASLPVNGYAILFGITANSVEIVKCSNQMLGVNVYAVTFDTEQQSIDFKNKLVSKFADIDHLRGNQGVMTIRTLQQIIF